MPEKSSSDSADKSRPPTRRRLLEARKEGNVPKSKDLTSAVELAAWLATGAMGAPLLVVKIDGLLEAALRDAAAPSPTDLGVLTAATMRTLVASILVVAAPAALASLVANFLQVGGVLSFKRLSFDLARLNPVDGLGRMFRSENLVELAKAVAKLLIVLVISYVAIRGEVKAAIALTAAGPGAALESLGTMLAGLLAPIVAAGLGVGVLDLLYQRQAYMKRMRMSVRDFREDRRRTQGDPRMKSRRSRLHREWANQSAALAAQRASVVVTNPTHFAVALIYDPAECEAPTVAAKGQDHVARIIREAARDAEVPIVENPSLARALHERVEVDEPVPSELFVAVAEVIVWANRLREQQDMQPDD